MSAFPASQPEIVDVSASLARIKTCLADVRSETESVIARLLERKLEIEASGKRLAILHSQCLTLCSYAAQIQAKLSDYPRAD
jgi:hypothetical protein